VLCVLCVEFFFGLRPKPALRALRRILLFFFWLRPKAALRKNRMSLKYIKFTAFPATLFH